MARDDDTLRSAPGTSWMRRETLETPARVAQLLREGQERAHEVAAAVRARNPRRAVSLARGSSDHACTLAHHLWKTRYGLWSFSCPPSHLLDAHHALDMADTLALSVSQSGQSTDLLRTVSRARAWGALTLAFVNTDNAPLAEAADWHVPVRAGPERSVAATKSFICSAVAVLDVSQRWQTDARLEQALNKLPDRLNEALSLPWTSLVDQLSAASSLLLVGRGAVMGALDEAALKFKETCQIHAESISAAELQHGPMALVGPGLPVWIVAPVGPHQAELLALAERLRTTQANVTVFCHGVEHPNALPMVATGDESTDALAWTIAVYLLAEHVAWARGLNPDQPRHLRKVTITC